MVLSICIFHMAAVAITYLVLYVDRKTQIMWTQLACYYVAKVDADI
jgi:hypothetical protein